MRSHDVEMKELIEEEGLEFEYYKGRLNPDLNGRLSSLSLNMPQWLLMVDWTLCIYCDTNMLHRCLRYGICTWTYLHIHCVHQQYNTHMLKEHLTVLF